MTVQWSIPDHVQAVLYAHPEGLTQAQIAVEVFGVTLHPTGDPVTDRERRSAIRAVQEAIQTLRRRDVPVIDSSEGMRIARTAEEAEAEFRRLRSRVRSQVITAWGLRRAARRMRDFETSQITLWDVA